MRTEKENTSASLEIVYVCPKCGWEYTEVDSTTCRPGLCLDD